MDKTVGLSGCIKAVDHQANMVLVQFYNPEMATLVEWWYPVRVLEKPNQAKSEAITDSTTMKANLIDLQRELMNVYAKKSIISLFSKGRLSLLDGPLNVKDMLNIVGLEGLSTQLLNVWKDQIHPQVNHSMSQQLITLYESGIRTSDLTEFLLKEALRLLETCTNLDAQASQSITSAKPPTLPPQRVLIEATRSVFVIFDRSCFLPLNSQASLEFYEDEACTAVIKSYTEKSKFLPLLIHSHQFWFKLSCSPAQRSNAKYKFEAVPVHPHLGLAFWIIEFLLDAAVKYIDDLSSLCLVLFNATLEFTYSIKTPCLLKESAFYLLGKIAQASNYPRATKQTIPVEKLAKLKEEMLQLYEIESKRDNAIFSTYLQSLIELMVTIKDLPFSERLFGGEAEAMDIDTVKENKNSTLKKLDTSKDGTLHIAIALASSIKSASEKVDKSPPSKSTTAARSEPMDDELATALALSLSEKQEPSDKPAEQPEQSPQDPGTTPHTDTDDVPLFDDMDEDMKAAIELSMQSSPDTTATTTTKTEEELAPKQPAPQINAEGTHSTNDSSHES